MMAITAITEYSRAVRRIPRVEFHATNSLGRLPARTSLRRIPRNSVLGFPLADFYPWLSIRRLSRSVVRGFPCGHAAHLANSVECFPCGHLPPRHSICRASTVRRADLCARTFLTCRWRFSAPPQAVFPYMYNIISLQFIKLHSVGGFHLNVSSHVYTI